MVLVFILGTTMVLGARALTVGLRLSGADSAERTGVSEVKSFVSAMGQAAAFGIPLAQVLGIESSEMRAAINTLDNVS